MSNTTQPRRAKLHRTLYAGGLTIALFTALPAVQAMGFNAYYPYVLQPSMPDGVAAQYEVTRLSWVLRPLREAHQQSLHSGWKSIAPPAANVEQ
ncbi:MAG: hypothetical protein QNJ69_13365 [Gammaproteobacteria bacterium]|nr:hypothetical protein [Gammaproteobacteria bacterium]